MTTPSVLTPVRKSNRIAVRKRAPEITRQNASVASQAATIAAIKAVHDLKTEQEVERKAVQNAQDSARQGAVDASLKAGPIWLTMDVVVTTGIKSVHDRTDGVKSKSNDPTYTKPNDSFDITFSHGQRGWVKTALLKEYPDIHKQVLHLMKLTKKKERGNDNSNRTKAHTAINNAIGNPHRTKKQITTNNVNRTNRQIATSNATRGTRKGKREAETIQHLMDFRTQMTSALAIWPASMLQDPSLDIEGESCLEGDIDMLMYQKFKSKVYHAALVKCVCAVC